MTIYELVVDLKRDEGWRPSVYQDHLGYWTIGYGFLVDDRKGGTIPKQIAEEWLALVVARNWDVLMDLEPWVHDQPDEVKRALGNMAYQLGVQGLRNFKKMLAKLEAGDRAGAADEALDSKWAKQTPERARRVAALLRGTP